MPLGFGLDGKEDIYAGVNCICPQASRDRAPVAEVIRRLEITERTYYRCKKRYGYADASQLRKIKQLELESRKLKQRVSDLGLNREI